MLAEIVHYLATPAGRDARRSGALKDAVSLWARGRRCRSAWAPHEKRTRAAIEAALDRVADHRIAVVLGSGLLRDVPIDRLRREFREVVLVDVVHLASVRLRAVFGRWRNVRFVSRDLSGYREMVERTRVARATGLDDLGAGLDPLGFLRWTVEVDFVVSANLMSQIAVGLRERVSRGGVAASLLPDDAPARAVEAHLDGLASLPCKTVLVTDVGYVRRDRSGRELECVDLTEGVTMPEANTTWTWTLVPFGEEGPGVEQVHTVIAVEDVAEDLR
jgi:hypothetical protein